MYEFALKSRILVQVVDFCACGFYIPTYIRVRVSVFYKLKTYFTLKIVLRANFCAGYELSSKYPYHN